MSLELKIVAITADDLRMHLDGLAAMMGIAAQPKAPPPAADSPAEAPASPAAAEPAAGAPKARRTRSSKEAQADAPADPSSSASSSAPGATSEASSSSASSGEAAGADTAGKASGAAPGASEAAPGAGSEKVTHADLKRLATEIVVRHPKRLAPVQDIVREVTGKVTSVTEVPDDMIGAVFALLTELRSAL